MANIGDIVSCNYAPSLPPYTLNGMEQVHGVVLTVNGHECGVYFPEATRGHNLHGLCPEGTGWFMSARFITVLEGV